MPLLSLRKLLSLCVAILICQYSFGTFYQEPIEKQLTAEQLSRTDIAVLADRLKRLRLSESRMGSKHPSLASVRSQIATTEAQLREMIGKPPSISKNSIPNPAVDAGDRPLPMKTSQDIAQHISGNRIERTSQWGFASWSQWPANVQELSALTKRSSQYQEAYPLLGLRNIVASGPMPGLGLMWGVEYDPIARCSYIYQWFDSSRSAEKVLYFEVPRRVLSIYYPTSFEKDGRFWVMSHREPSDDYSFVSEDWKYVVFELHADPRPPFQIRPVSESPICLIRSQANEPLEAIVSSQQRGWFLEGDVELKALNAVLSEDPCQLKQIDGKRCVLERENVLDANSPMYRAMISQWTAFQSRVSSVGMQAKSLTLSHCNLGINSTGEVLLVDGLGKVKAIRKKVTEDEAFSVWPPQKLSQLGWYESLTDGALSGRFYKYSYQVLSENQDAQKWASSHGVGKSEGDFSGLRSDYWYCIPETETLQKGQQDSSMFPQGSILLQTISAGLGVDVGDQIPYHKIETRCLVFVDGEWFAFSYLWDSEQADAVLVQADQQIEYQVSGQTNPFSYEVRKSISCFECHHQGALSLSPEMVKDHQKEGLSEGMPVHQMDWTQTPLSNVSAGFDRLAWAPILVRGQDGFKSMQSPGVDETLSAVGEVDWDWFKKSFLDETVEPWFRASFRPSGFFCTELDETWTPSPKPSGTLVSQTWQIYTMAQGYAISRDPKYLDAMKKGIRFLSDHFADKEFGGYYYQVDESGQVIDRGKDGYGHAFVIFALATAAKVSGEIGYAKDALKCWDTLRANMMEPNGGLMWKAAENFKGLNRRSQNPNMHLFEGMVELYDVTRDPGVYEDTKKLMEFVLHRLRHVDGVIPEDFQINWDQPVLKSEVPYIVMGHQVEWAFLISRAVEVGFPRRYLLIGQELMDFAMENGYDPQEGGLQEGPDRGKGAWQQAEFLRALIRYYSMHGRGDYLLPIKKTQALIQENFIDHQYGGWIEWGNKNKGNHWKAASHEVAMYIEGIRAARLKQIIDRRASR
jgi:mannose/cellobiose epimerase-like protein (N-acyl-D-glucosamine 2-epimerase family)